MVSLLIIFFLMNNINMVLARLLRDLCIYIAVNLFLSSPTVVLVHFSQCYVDMVNLPFYIASCDNL